MAPHRRIILDRSDFEVLVRLVETHTEGPLARQAELLDLELGLAEIRERVPGDVVTMNSTVVFEDEATGERREATLCFPHEAATGTGRVSVLAPVGSALLGLSVGQSIEWPVPGGKTRRLRVVDVPSQPQRSHA